MTCRGFCPPKLRQLREDACLTALCPASALSGAEIAANKKEEANVQTNKLGTETLAGLELL